MGGRARSARGRRPSQGPISPGGPSPSPAHVEPPSVDAYRSSLDYLTRLEVSAGWDLKLERMRAAVALRGHPERAWPAVHIAGTNGKGSTAAMVEAVLRAAGYRTGLYTSPHLVDFTERIRVDGRTIPRDVVVALVDDLRTDLARAGIALTHF